MEEDNNDELCHYGVPGMRWGQRKAIQIQARKDRAIQKYQAIQQKNPNSKKAQKAKIKSEKINASKYGKTNKQLVVDGALKHIGSLGLQTAAVTALIASGGLAAAPVLTAVGATSISAVGTVYRGSNFVSTLIKTHNNSKSIKQNLNK